MQRTGLLISLVLIAGSTASAQTDSTRAYASEVLSDAAGRTSLAAPSSSVTIGGVAQFRYNINSRDNAPGGDEDLTLGFETTRTVLHASGAINDKISYRIQGGFDSSGGGFSLEDAYGVYGVDDHWAVGFGQVYFPVLWEEFVQTQFASLAAEASATNAAFAVNRVQGAWAQYGDEKFRMWAAFHDGAGSLNTDFNSSSEADYAFTWRGEYMFQGADWGRFSDFTSWQNSETTSKLGGALHWQSGGDTGGPTSDLDIFLGTLDFQIEGNGWNAFAAGILRSIDSDSFTDALLDYGFVVQGGMFFNETWEGFARFDTTIPDSDRAGDPDAFSTITVGVNNYIIPESHAAKFTLDLQYFVDQQDTSINPADTATGLLAASEDSQFNIRGQFQWKF